MVELGGGEAGAVAAKHGLVKRDGQDQPGEVVGGELGIVEATEESPLGQVAQAAGERREDALGYTFVVAPR